MGCEYASVKISDGPQILFIFAFPKYFLVSAVKNLNWQATVKLDIRMSTGMKILTEKDIDVAE